MTDKLYFVNKKVLPDYIETVLKIKDELDGGSNLNISDLCKREGISRSTFYKYKDMVFRPAKNDGAKAIISFKALNVAGVLTSALSIFASYNANIITLNQEIPINDYAFITVSIDMSNIRKNLAELVDELKNLENIKKVELVAYEA